MRITDDDIIGILKRDGPSSSSYVAQELGTTDITKIQRHLKSLAKYNILECKALDHTNFYFIPGDQRPVNARERKNGAGRAKFLAHIENMNEGEITNSVKVAEACDCSVSYARKLIIKSGQFVKRERVNSKYKWEKGASE